MQRESAYEPERAPCRCYKSACRGPGVQRCAMQSLHLPFYSQLCKPMERLHGKQQAKETEDLGCEFVSEDCHGEARLGNRKPRTVVQILSLLVPKLAEEYSLKHSSNQQAHNKGLELNHLRHRGDVHGVADVEGGQTVDKDVRKKRNWKEKKRILNVDSAFTVGRARVHRERERHRCGGRTPARRGTRYTMRSLDMEPEGTLSIRRKTLRVQFTTLYTSQEATARAAQ